MAVFNEKFMKIAIEEGKKGLEETGFGPFGACVVKDGEVLSVGNNRVAHESDPTAHAEITAIRRACKELGNFELKGCEIYSTTEPCPMCFAAIYWCRADALYYGTTRFEAADIGFDDQFIYDELDKDLIKRRLKTFPDKMHDECMELFDIWRDKEDRVDY